MDRVERFDFQTSVEAFLEENKVYELFETLLKDLIAKRPKDPLDFLIDKLSKPQQRRVFLVGPAGSNSKEVGQAIAAKFKWNCISVGKLLKDEVAKKSEIGTAIQKEFNAQRFVPDQICIDLVKKEINRFESSGQSWVLEGFPRTQVQALALQKLGLVPDKVILLSIKDQAFHEQIKKNMKAAHTPLFGSQLDEAANKAVDEYKLHIKGVKEAYRGFVYEYDEYDPDKKSHNDVYYDLSYVLGIRYMKGASRRPPRVILLGPPGAGRSTQAKIVAKKFGLVHVSTRQLIKEETQRNPSLAKLIQECMHDGKMVPESVISPLIINRLGESDCQVNGWVLDGFPQNEAQINLLKSMKLRPSHVFMLDQSETAIVRRLSNRRIDPETGRVYNNVREFPPSDPEVAARLQEFPEDKENILRMRIATWTSNQYVIEEEFGDIINTIPADASIDEVARTIAEGILPAHDLAHAQ